MPESKQFGADDLGAALAYIDGLPTQIRRVYLDVKDERGDWCCVYADERAHFQRALGTLINGRSFRLRGSEFPTTIQ
jgi:hypothetical protein